MTNFFIILAISKSYQVNIIKFIYDTILFSLVTCNKGLL